MKHYCIIFTITCICFSGCNSQSGRNAGVQTDFYTIDFEKSFDIKQQMFISEIADNVEYIELITPKELPISRIWKVINFEDYLIVKARGDVYLFHRNGQFIRKIGSRDRKSTRLNSSH